MPRLTPEAKDCIKTLKDTLPNRQLAAHLEQHGYGKYSQAAVGRYKNKLKKEISDTLDTSETIQTLGEKDKSLFELGKGSEGLIWEKDPKPKKKRTPRVPSINDFMLKLEASDSFSAKHLRQKLNARGKFATINKERYIRIIRDTLDVLGE